MNKRIIIPSISVILVILLAATVLGITYLNNQESARQQNVSENTRMAMQDTPTEQAEDESTSDVTQKPQASAPGAYVNYSNDVIASTAGKKVLFFHAPWCPQCRQIDSEINAQASLPENTTIIKVDYDSHQDLRQKYGVTLQTTFVEVDDNGDSIQKYVAYNEPTYETVKQNILE